MAGVTDGMIRAFAEDHGATFPVMRDPDRTYYDYQAVGSSAPFPLDVIVDREGIVRYVDTRFEPDELQEVIDGLLE